MPTGIPSETPGRLPEGGVGDLRYAGTLEKAGKVSNNAAVKKAAVEAKEVSPESGHHPAEDDSVHSETCGRKRKMKKSVTMW